MSRKCRTPEEIINKLREAEVGLARGMTVPEAEPYTQVTVTFEIVDDATFTILVPADGDSDGVYDQFDLNDDGDFDDANELDNCPEAYNPGQEDGDGDGSGNACDNCADVSNPGQEDFEPDGIGDVCDDSDVDGFFDAVELYLPTDPTDACSDGPTHDAWPLENTVDTEIDVTGDVYNYVGRIGASPGSSEWWQRLDLDMGGDIDVTGDVYLYAGRIGESCT